MKRLNLRSKVAYFFSLLILMTSFANAELKELDDQSLEDQKGQAGITIDMEFKLSIGEIAWKFDDGKIVKDKKTMDYNYQPPPRIEYVLPDGK